MPANKNLNSPFPWASLQDPNLHSGVLACTGSVTVNLGIGHNNFTPTVSVQGGTAALANDAVAITWAYGSALGTFIIYTWKNTSTSNPTLIAATTAVNVSFNVTVDSSVG
jgi:hypothetical protein